MKNQKIEMFIARLRAPVKAPKARKKVARGERKRNIWMISYLFSARDLDGPVNVFLGGGVK
jgi:hypothetical protein